MSRDGQGDFEQRLLLAVKEVGILHRNLGFVILRTFRRSHSCFRRLRVCSVGADRSLP